MIQYDYAPLAGIQINSDGFISWRTLTGLSKEEPTVYYVLIGDMPYKEAHDLSYFQRVLEQPNIRPTYHIFVLNYDESVLYEIPNDDIIFDSVNYKESYNNGQRRTLEFSVANIDGKYTPSVNGLWYNTKILYMPGFIVDQQEFLFASGIYVLDNFNFGFGVNDRKVTYSFKDKFSYYDGPSGVLTNATEFKPGITVQELITQIQNINGADENVFDLKPCIISSDVQKFQLQQTIRIESGGKLSSVIDQVATQMSCEYFYNSNGNLCFYPLNETMNDDDKPIIWAYKKDDVNELNFSSTEQLINVIKVQSSDINGQIYSAIVKNENLGSNINIYYIKERYGETIQDENIRSNEQAKERGQFELRKNAILVFQQTITVPYNPILKVNNLIELEEDDLGLHGDRFLINSISYSSGSPQMQLEITNINSLPFIGGVNYRGK